MPRRNDLKSLPTSYLGSASPFDDHQPAGRRSQRPNELLTAAVHLADDLLEESPAATLGAKGGKTTAKRGSAYFRKIAAMRKAFKGGRPKGNRPD